MKSYLMVPVVALLASVMLVGGCKSQEEFDKLQMQNRNMQDRLGEAVSQAERMRQENTQLQNKLKELTAMLKAKDEQIALLNEKAGTLQKTVDELYARLRDQKTVAPEPKEIALEPGLNRELQKLAEENGWTWDAKRGMVKVSSDLLFAPGSDDINPEAKAALDKFAKIMNGDVAKKYNVYIAGHTDDMPIKQGTTSKMHPTNWYLSAHRAVSVETLLAKAGLEDKRQAAMGFGEWHPIADNAPNHKGNKLNRRVELWILPPDRFLTVTGGAAEPAGTLPEATEPAPESKAPVKAPVDNTAKTPAPPVEAVGK